MELQGGAPQSSEGRSTSGRMSGRCRRHAPAPEELHRRRKRMCITGMTALGRMLDGPGEHRRKGTHGRAAKVRSATAGPTVTSDTTRHDHMLQVRNLREASAGVLWPTGTGLTRSVLQNRQSLPAEVKAASYSWHAAAWDERNVDLLGLPAVPYWIEVVDKELVCLASGRGGVDTECLWLE